MRTHLLFLVSFVACSGEKDSTTGLTGDTSAPTTDTDTGPVVDTDTGTNQGACGDPVLYDLQVIGRVTGPTGTASEGAHVVLEDRVWEPGTTLGEGFTDAKGNFAVAVVGLTSLEDCWGLLGYYVVADKGTFYAERGVNSELFNAIEDGTLVADLSAFPLELEKGSQ